MLSPAGVPRYPLHYDIWEELNNLPKHQRPEKLALKVGKFIWNRRWSPFGMMRKSGKTCIECTIKNYVNRRFQSIPKDELEDYKEYLK